MNSGKIRIRFEWFEPWFDKRQNFFTQLLIDAGINCELVADRKARADLEFVSVYPPLKRDVQARIHRLKKRLPVWQLDTTETYPLQYEPESTNYKTRIWYTSENIRPPVQENIDLTFSFDQDSYRGTNIYLPLWQLHLNHEKKFGRPLNPNSSLGTESSIEKLRVKRTLNTTNLSQRKFACAFVANPQPTRLRMIEELSRYGQVDVFGLYSGKPVPNKYEIAKDYNFMICPENDVFPGYVTEKLMDAYLCETVPVYWGDLGGEGHINHKAFINLLDYKSIEDFAHQIASLDFLGYKTIYEQPFMLKELDFRELREALVAKL
jgi:hypothetical protein